MKKNMEKYRVTLFVLSVVVLMQTMTGCQSSNTSSGIREKKDRVVSHNSGNTIIETILSASVGGNEGALIKKQMDKQAGELRSCFKDAKVERLAEGILITIDAQLLFDRDARSLHSMGKLKSLAKLLNKYGYTNTLIEAHTDNTGEELYNLSLSEKRAEQVKEYLVEQGVNAARIKSKGYGETQPLTANDSESAKSINRRLEIAIYSNEDVRTLALQGKVGEYIASKR